MYDRHPRDLAMFHDMAARVSKLLDVQEARIRPAGIDWPESDTASTPSSAGTYVGFGYCQMNTFLKLKTGQVPIKRNLPLRENDPQRL